jgi:hypothetical protein
MYIQLIGRIEALPKLVAETGPTFFDKGSYAKGSHGK